MNTEVSTESDDSRLANLRKKHADHCELITTSGDSLEGNEIAQFFACKQKLATHAEDFSRVEAELDSKLDDLRTWAAPLSESGFSRNSGDTLIDLAALAIGAFAVSLSLIHI